MLSEEHVDIPHASTPAMSVFIHSQFIIYFRKIPGPGVVTPFTPPLLSAPLVTPVFSWSHGANFPVISIVNNDHNLVISKNE